MYFYCCLKIDRKLALFLEEVAMENQVTGHGCMHRNMKCSSHCESKGKIKEKGLHPK